MRIERHGETPMPNKDREKNYRNRKEILSEYYQPSEIALSPEEETALTPIYNSLRETEPRYCEKVPLAEGGEKRVSRVYDRRLGRHVAMAHAAHAKTPKEQEQFLREAKLTANLAHPNIVPIHNMGIDAEGSPFFSMELVPGDSLKDILKKIGSNQPDYRSQYPLDIMLGIFNKVCDAVAYAHSRNVLHLDIKPDNIRVGQFGEVFLCDWGLSLVKKSSTDTGELESGQLDGDILNDMTLTGTMKGTPGFMAPEQVNNQNKSQQTDIYALGTILYLILTHKLPIDGKNAQELIENTRLGKIIHPRKRNALHPCPTGLAAVAMKALALEPANRYASVQNLQSDVNRYLAGYPTHAEQAGIITRSILLTQRHRKLTFWLMTFFALLTLVLSVALPIIHREKMNAETNFALYKQKQEEVSRINKKLSELSFHAKQAPSYIYARKSIGIITLLLQQESIDQETKNSMIFHKAQMQFVLQHFNAALHTFEQLQDPDETTQQLTKLSRHYAEIKPNDFDRLSDDNLAPLLTNLRKSIALFIYYHNRVKDYRNTTPEEHIQIVAVMLNRLHGFPISSPIPDLKLRKSPKGYHLDLSHTPYSSFRMHMPFTHEINILQPLHLYSLDISYTSTCLVNELSRLQIKELHMVGIKLTPQSKIHSLFKNMGLEKVVIGKGEYPKFLVEKWRLLLEVEEVEVPRSKIKISAIQTLDEPLQPQGSGAPSPGF